MKDSISKTINKAENVSNNYIVKSDSGKFISDLVHEIFFFFCSFSLQMRCDDDCALLWKVLLIVSILSSDSTYPDLFRLVSDYPLLSYQGGFITSRHSIISGFDNYKTTGNLGDFLAALNKKKSFNYPQPFILGLVVITIFLGVRKVHTKKQTKNSVWKLKANKWYVVSFFNTL